MCLNGQSYRERLAREVFPSPATRGSKKDSYRAITPAAEAVRVLAYLALPGSLQAKQLHHLHPQLSQGQSCHKAKNVSYLCTQGHFGMSKSLRPCRLQPARLLCQGGEFSRQEYWSVLVNTDCHTFPECYISCCPSHQLP